MRIIPLALALIVAAKLVIFSPTGVAVTDFTSLERCEKARAELLAQVARDAEQRAPKGYKIVQPPAVSAVCIPA